MPTVTLAEIYAAQGHRARAVETLRRVLEREPEHAAAQALLARLEDEAYVPPAPRLPPEPEIEPELYVEEEDDDDAGGLAALDAAATADVAGAETLELPVVDDAAYVDAHAKTDAFEIVPEAVAAAEARAVAALAIEEPEEGPEEIDDCFAIPLARDEVGGRMYVRWNVSWSAIGALLGARPSGRFVVRAHIVTPTWDGPSTETRDLIVDPDEGEAVLQALPAPSVVRVAVGWREGSAFVPLAHSPALEMGRNRRLMIWTTSGPVPVVLDDPRAASLARALEASRRAARAHG